MKRAVCFLLALTCLRCVWATQLEHKPEVPPQEPRVGLLDCVNSFLLLGVRFYQHYITDVDDHSCVMHPSCSEYCALSLQRHSPFLATLQTTDRLLRCGHEIRYYQRTLTPIGPRCEDQP